MPAGDNDHEVDLITSILDTFVHAPLGLLLGGPAEPDELVRKGRTQVANARSIGQLVVNAYCRGPIKPDTAPPGSVGGIVGYDTLTVREVLPQLTGRTERDLGAIRAHETANRNRKTVLTRIDQLLEAKRTPSGAG